MLTKTSSPQDVQTSVTEKCTFRAGAPSGMEASKLHEFSMEILYLGDKNNSSEILVKHICCHAHIKIL